VLCSVLLVGVLGGLYPAFLPVALPAGAGAQGQPSASETPGSGGCARLVVGQFAVSIGLIICTAVIYGQTVYARTVDPGYKRDHILQVDELSRYQLSTRADDRRADEARARRRRSAGLTDIGVNTDNNNNTGIMVPGNRAVTSAI
jgi:putative ABC transport system permease protein